MAEAGGACRLPRPARERLTPLALIGLFALSAAAAALFAFWFAGMGLRPVYGAIIGFPAPAPLAWLLHRLDRRDMERLDRENQRIGWGPQEAETARRLAAWREARK